MPITKKDKPKLNKDSNYYKLKTENYLKDSLPHQTTIPNRQYFNREN